MLKVGWDADIFMVICLFGKALYLKSTNVFKGHRKLLRRFNITSLFIILKGSTHNEPNQGCARANATDNVLLKIQNKLKSDEEDNS